MKRNQGKCRNGFTCTILCTCWLVTMLRGTPEKTLRSSAFTTLCARSTATPSSSQMDEPTLSFSFSLADSLCLFDDGVGISSTEVAGEATRRLSTPETMGVASAEGRKDGRTLPGDANSLFTNVRQKFVLLGPHLGVHIFVESGLHLYKKNKK